MRPFVGTKAQQRVFNFKVLFFINWKLSVLPYFCGRSNINKMDIFLLQANPVSLTQSANSASYLPIGIQFFFALGFVTLVLGVTHLLGPKRKTSDKLSNFESGIQAVGNARQPMAVKYFLVAILFVLFDVEVIFFYPYAINFKALGWEGFFAVLLFVLLFLVGFIYIIKKGALTWEE
ncbi:MAG TPA: NADH-quinone oxidoreductase subunit A [Puia sp.]|nr:NADH-quinone oxidoreductase subunit A [Puia sp.]